MPIVSVMEKQVVAEGSVEDQSSNIKREEEAKNKEDQSFNRDKKEISEAPCTC